MKKIIIDSRMRKIEKDFLIEHGYELIELEKSKDVYEEISAHPDIFCTKVGNNLIAEPNTYGYIKKLDKRMAVVLGEKNIGKKYPQDIKYNLCIIGKYAIHNYKYTDNVVKQYVEANGFDMVSVSQGYTNCSIAVIDDKSAITSDCGIYRKLKDTNLDVLFIDQEDIKLLNSVGKNGYSEKTGFIGGAMARVDNMIFIFGDLNYLKSGKIIKGFIESKGMQVIDFSGYDIIDYGGVIVI